MHSSSLNIFRRMKTELSVVSICTIRALQSAFASKTIEVRRCRDELLMLFVIYRQLYTIGIRKTEIYATLKLARCSTFVRTVERATTLNPDKEILFVDDTSETMWEWTRPDRAWTFDLIAVRSRPELLLSLDLYSILQAKKKHSKQIKRST